MKNSTFASFGNSVIKSQFFNGGKIIKWKVGAVEKCPRWRSLCRSHLCALLQISHYFDFTSQKICSTSYKYKYKSKNLYYKLQVQVQVQVQFTSGEEQAPGSPNKVGKKKIFGSLETLRKRANLSRKNAIACFVLFKMFFIIFVLVQKYIIANVEKKQGKK